MENSNETPYFGLHVAKLENNLRTLKKLEERCNIKILHTIKCFNEPAAIDIISKNLSGFSISNPNEYDKIKDFDTGHVHTYSPVYHATQIASLASVSDSMSFNSIGQWTKYARMASVSSSVGIRINPDIQINQPSYCDASDNNSRFGVPEDEFFDYFSKDHALPDGLHFHIFCCQNFDSLDKLLGHLQNKYDEILKKIKWINLGGGIRLTTKSFDKESFVLKINLFKAKYPHLCIYLEPGSAVVANSGDLFCTVVEIVDRGDYSVAIVDTSIEAHLLDIAITKVKPIVQGSTNDGYSYKISGISCIAGDLIGEYCFSHKLKVSDVVIIKNVLGYNISKQTRFNGINYAKLVLI